MAREYGEPQRYCDHCEVWSDFSRCSVCHGPTREQDSEPLDYDRLRELRAEKRCGE